MLFIFMKFNVAISILYIFLYYLKMTGPAETCRD